MKLDLSNLIFAKSIAAIIKAKFLNETIVNVPDVDLAYDKESCDNVEELTYNLRYHVKVWENHEACIKYREILIAYTNLSEAQKRRLFLNEKFRNFSMKGFYTHAEVIEMNTIFEIFMNLEANY